MISHVNTLLTGFLLVLSIHLAAQPNDQPLTRQVYRYASLSNTVWELALEERFAYLPTGEPTLRDRRGYGYTPYRVETRYDSNRNPIQIFDLYIPDGSTKFDTSAYRYLVWDDAGNLLEEQYFSEIESTLTMTFRATFQYDAQGCLIQRDDYRAGIDQETGEPGIVLSATTLFGRTNDCQITSQETFNPQSQYYTRSEYRLDDSGYPEEIRYSYLDPIQLEYVTTAVEYYTHDEQGRVLSMVYENYASSPDTMRERTLYTYANDLEMPISTVKEIYVDSLADWVLSRSETYFVTGENEVLPLEFISIYTDPLYHIESTSTYEYELGPEGKVLSLHQVESTTANDTLVSEIITDEQYEYYCDGKVSEILRDIYTFQAWLGEEPTIRTSVEWEFLTYGKNSACSKAPDEFALLIYPNPAETEAWASCELMHFPGTLIRVMGMDGRVVYHQQSPLAAEIPLKIGHLTPGIYWVELRNADLNQSVSQKLLVK